MDGCFVLFLYSTHLCNVYLGIKVEEARVKGDSLSNLRLRLRVGERKKERDRFLVYYESLKRDLNKRLIFECRCDVRLKTKGEGCTHTLCGVRNRNT